MFEACIDFSNTSMTSLRFSLNIREVKKKQV